MPFAVDEDQMRGNDEKGVQKKISIDPAHPPVKPIPHNEFPRVLYKHPNEPFKTVEHRNTQHEIVQVERVPADHLTRVVADKKELEAAMKDGWVKEPFIPAPAPDPNEGLYSTT